MVVVDVEESGVGQGKTDSQAEGNRVLDQSQRATTEE